MVDPVSPTVAAKAAPLAGRLLLKWRRSNEVNNLFRLLKGAILADAAITPADRKPVWEQLQAQRTDPTLLGGLHAFMEYADLAGLRTIRGRLREVLRLADDIDNKQVVDLIGSPRRSPSRGGCACPCTATTASCEPLRAGRALPAFGTVALLDALTDPRPDRLHRPARRPASSAGQRGVGGPPDQR